MKIQSITNIYNPFSISRLNNSQSQLNITSSFKNNGHVGDIVSFRAKAYNADSVENPTGHCAYCGCKVYNEQQIDSLAKEMLRDSSHRLQGTIRSILEKLETAQRSNELTVAKQIENKEEIEFYKKLFQQSVDKSWLKGEAIFSQVYGLEPEDALAKLKKNMRPLMRTIDHVSPQKLGEDNKDADVNLVEACYCCNHDLKKGMPFSEFYTMYPSIKENMPVDKFKYAHAELLSSSSSSILSRVSASNLIKYVNSLFEQRTRAISQLDSVDFRIAESSPSVEHSIRTCNDEIDEKDEQITDLRAKLATMAGDDEYQAMLDRIRLQAKKSEIDDELSGLREKRQNASRAMNDLKNPPKKGKKAKTNLSQDQIEQKIASYRQQLIELKGQIEQKEQEQAENEAELQVLDEVYPTPELLQGQKNSYDGVVNAYAQLEAETSRREQLFHISSILEFDIAKLKEQIATYSEDDFNPSNYSQEEQAQYQQYSSLIDALKYIEQHSNAGGVKSLVNKSAKVQIEQQIEGFKEYPVIIAATNHIKKKELIAQLDRLLSDKANGDREIQASNSKITQLRRITSKCSLQEAKDKSQEIAIAIRRLTEKQNYLKIPQTIETLEAEILVLRSAINDLRMKKQQIDALK